MVNQNLLFFLNILPLASIIRILVIIVAAFLGQKFLRILVKRGIGFIERRQGEKKEDFEKRTSTLAGVFANSAMVVIWLLTVLMIVSEFGINITPILTGAGIAGLAIGFGAQNLVRDLLSGTFILLENQYSKGDVVRIADSDGLVESVSLRRTVLRDLDGVVHYIPNGQITTASNFTKVFSAVNLDIPVSYEEDLDEVFAVLNKVGQDLARDKTFGPMITKAPQVLRVEAFQPTAVMVKMLGETKPNKQWEVTGELRKRIKVVFDQEKIKFF